MKILATAKYPLTAFPGVLRMVTGPRGRSVAQPGAAAQGPDDVLNTNRRQGRAAIPVGPMIELRYADLRCARFRVPEWVSAPEIIECSGKRFVRSNKNVYREAATFSLFVGYNAEAVAEQPLLVAGLTTRGAPP